MSKNFSEPFWKQFSAILKQIQARLLVISSDISDCHFREFQLISIDFNWPAFVRFLLFFQTARYAFHIDTIPKVINHFWITLSQEKQL